MGTILATPPPVRARRRPWPVRLVRVAVGAVLAAVLVCAAALGLGWVLTPSVDDAPALVAAHLAAHDAPALDGPVPSKLADALTATEDAHFASEPGVDPIGVVRAAWGAVSGTEQGGATLYQQLAKNLYSGGQQSFTDRAEDVVLAVKLNATYSDAQVLRMYLDDGYYGHGFTGLTAATQGYFGVPPADLSWAQASLLAGLFQAPSSYDPFRHPDVARTRQAHVLDRLVAVGTLSRSLADRIAGESWGLLGG